MLKNELRKIEARKKEREKKTQDLQKLIDTATPAAIKSDKKIGKKKLSPTTALKTPKQDLTNVESSGIKYPDSKASGVTLRSGRLKLPSTVPQKKSKAVESMLSEIGVDPNPMPTEEICNEFNELRSELVLLFDLKNALSTCESELHSLKAQYEALCPGKSLEIPDKLKSTGSSNVTGVAASAILTASKEKPKNISDVIDVVGNGSTPVVRKRKAAMEQVNVLKKIKNKNF